jgi:hypothetical protein
MGPAGLWRRLAVPVLVGTVPAVLALACGARSGLLVVELGDASLDAPELEGAPTSDATQDVMSRDSTAPDVAPDKRPPDCTSDAACDDGVACTMDSCDLASGTCSHEPSDGLCPPGFTCQPPTGCVATAFAADATDLYGVDVSSWTVAKIGPTSGHSLIDIALDSSGRLYGVSDMFLYSLDPLTGAATAVGPIAGFPAALGFGPDGTLYVAAQHNSVGANGVFIVDPKTGDETIVTDFPFGYGASGDLAVEGRTLYATVAGGTEDVLATIDLDTLEGNVEGPIGFGCVFGLVLQAGGLFGFTCKGQVIQIDPSSGAATVVSMPGESFTGAATP